MTAAELAERAGVSPVTIRKVERGDPTVSLGVAFEVASLVGVPLVGESAERRSLDADRLGNRLAVLPKRVRPRDVDDEF
jgi:transcriptional regulator with XRE-family HTH domain